LEYHWNHRNFRNTDPAPEKLNVGLLSGTGCSVSVQVWDLGGGLGSAAVGEYLQQEVVVVEESVEITIRY